MVVIKDYVLRPLVAIAVFWTGRVINDIRNVVVERQTKNPEMYPANYDVVKAGMFFVVCLVAQILFRQMFDPIARMMIARKPRWTHEVWGAKLVRCCDAFYKFLFYSIMTVCGFMLLRDQDFTPWALGGSGDARNCWTGGYPFQVVSVALQNFYLAHIGFHVCELAMLLVEKRHPDFWEMLLHGALACSLLSISYALNYVRIGSLVLVLHGATDIFIYASKALVDTTFSRLTGVSYFALLATYAWFRIFVYPVHVMNSAWVQSREASTEPIYGWGYLNFALCALLLLHMYWFGLIVKIGLYFRTTGQTKDLQANLSALELDKKAA